MINQKQMNLTITEGLKRSTGCEVVKSNLTKAPIPPYPYLSFTMTQDKTRKGTYSSGQKKYIPLSQTWSITAHGNADDSAFETAMTARDWLEEKGRIRLNDMGIVVQDVSAIQNRDTLLTVAYEYRKGFDVIFSMMNVIDIQEIETIEIANMERE